jgi:hypothetical protein
MEGLSLRFCRIFAAMPLTQALADAVFSQGEGHSGNPLVPSKAGNEDSGAH